jgi:hypothetical protein
MEVLFYVGGGGGPVGAICGCGLGGASGGDMSL